MSTSFRFCFTVDTEPDNLWENQATYSFDSFRRLPAFHRLLIEAGSRPTYLTTSEVVESDLGRAAIENCLSVGGCEIGAHFHTWTREWPFDVPNIGKAPVMAMAHILGRGVEERMLSYTCESIYKTLGIEPKSYRGGRWSFGPESPRILARCGITVDSTVTPGLSWRDKTNCLVDGPDFRFAPESPFSVLDRGVNGSAPLVELPVGTAPFPRAWKSLFRRQYFERYLHAIGKRTGLTLGYHWLRPTFSSIENMRAVMRALKSRHCSVWVFMIHSSEIIPCKLLPTEERVRGFTERCLSAISHAKELGAEPATLTEAGEWAQKRGLPSLPLPRIFPHLKCDWPGGLKELNEQ